MYLLFFRALIFLNSRSITSWEYQGERLEGSPPGEDCHPLWSLASDHFDSLLPASDIRFPRIGVSASCIPKMVSRCFLGFLLHLLCCDRERANLTFLMGS